MCVSQNNRLFLTIVLGLFLVSGCSGHSLKYGANSEGEEMAAKEGMSGTGETSWSGVARNPDGTLMHGGSVDGNNPFFRSGQGTSNSIGAGTSEMSSIDGVASVCSRERVRLRTSIWRSRWTWARSWRSYRVWEWVCQYE